MFSDRKPKKNYFNIIDGKLTIRAEQSTPNAVSRVNKLGNTVWEVKHDDFKGKLTAISVNDSPYGKVWNFDFKCADESIWSLQMQYSSSFAKALLKKLPNINLTEEFTISPFSGEIDGKRINTISVYQNNVKIEPFYTKDQPNGLPQMEPITVKGEQIWDDTKQLAFLQEMAELTIQKMISSEEGEIDGKRINTISVYQNNVKIEPFYTPVVSKNIETIEEMEKAMGLDDDAVTIDPEDLPF